MYSNSKGKSRDLFTLIRDIKSEERKQDQLLYASLTLVPRLFGDWYANQRSGIVITRAGFIHEHYDLMLNEYLYKLHSVYTKHCDLSCNTQLATWVRFMRVGRLERELQMVQLSVTRRSCIAILWVGLVSFVAITLCVAFQRVFIVVSVYFVIDSVRKLPDTPSYTVVTKCSVCVSYSGSGGFESGPQERLFCPLFKSL
jgi:hypothetical protein